MKQEVDGLDLVRLQAESWGLWLEDEQLRLLGEYGSLLATYEKANVIGVRDRRTVMVDHVLDSISCMLFGPLGDMGKLADVGSGGGLPGIPLKIVAPNLDVALFESTGKKADFLRRVVENLSLLRAVIIPGRVEELARAGGHRASYDVATARAVARLSVVAEYCVPLLKVGGFAISMKGRLGQDELAEGERAAALLGAQMRRVVRVPHLPEVGDRERRLVIIEKTRETPAEYPRKVGVPTKRPLGVV